MTETPIEAVESVETAETTEAVAADEPTGRQSARKVRTGVVVSDKMDKTIVVAVEDRAKHALYGKIMTRTERFKCHDENNEAGVGDTVRVMETRPLSRTKRWRLLEIVEKAK